MVSAVAVFQFHLPVIIDQIPISNRHPPVVSVQWESFPWIFHYEASVWSTSATFFLFFVPAIKDVKNGYTSF